LNLNQVRNTKQQAHQQQLPCTSHCTSGALYSAGCAEVASSYTLDMQLDADAVAAAWGPASCLPASVGQLWALSSGNCASSSGGHLRVLSSCLVMI
jgi:hypothetical protein